MKNNKYWLIGLLLIAFLSQSMATVAMPCYLLSQADMNVLQKMSHTGQSNKIHQCCKLQGHCLSGNCTQALISYRFNTNTLTFNIHATDTELSSPLNPLILPNFRPPIFS